MFFKDKVVWITGASSGIGEYMAYAFAKKGAKLVLSSRKQVELERVKKNCQEGTEILVLPLDMEEFDEFPMLSRKVIEHFGYISILVNNAGISQRALAAETKFEVDQRIMNINYLGTVALTKSVLPYMQKQEFGNIVVMSSVLGKIEAPYRSAYCASKHALHGFFDALRAEMYKNNIWVTILCPGYVRTNVTINALKGDGTTNNEMAVSTAHGLSPEQFAKKALAAIRNNRREVIIGKKEILGVTLKRLWPGLFALISRNMRLN